MFACTTPEELEFLFQMGVRNKTMASHRLNNASSRSHCIFEIKIEFSDMKDPDDVVVSKLALVDLAGSERSSWVNTDGRLAKEAIEINKSLFTLRQVINAIYDSQNRGSKNEHHIPYRESKLTSLLKQSIGGNSYCLMVIFSPFNVVFFLIVFRLRVYLQVMITMKRICRPWAMRQRLQRYKTNLSEMMIQSGKLYRI